MSGAEYISGGFDSASYIDSGGYQEVDSGGEANGAVVYGTQAVAYGGYAYYTTVFGFGGEVVLSGGADYYGDVSSGGFKAIDSGGSASSA